MAFIVPDPADGNNTDPQLFDALTAALDHKTAVASTSRARQRARAEWRVLARHDIRPPEPGDMALWCDWCDTEERAVAWPCPDVRDLAARHRVPVTLPREDTP